MSSTRDLVLKTLLTRQRCTINDLADEVGINPISVRHHISSLQVEGLVDSVEERHGVGRPRRFYFLTETGLERFPTRYLRLTIRLLEQIKETMPPALIQNIFSQMAQDLANDYAAEAHLEGLSLEERLDVMKSLLQREGFTIEWEKQGDQYQIQEVNCPYLQVSQNHPEVCAMDQTLISSMLAVPAEKVRCILNGDHHCIYVVPTPKPTENPA